MYTADKIRVGDKVLVFHPEYVSGKVGVVRGSESKSINTAKERWIIQVESENRDNILVSLNPEEFHKLSHTIK